MDWQSSTSGNRLDTIGAVLGTSAGTVITSPGSANTKTGAAWAALTTSTPVSASGITLTINNPTAIIASRLIDIGIGPSGSEIVIIPNILYTSGEADIPLIVYFPVRIPAGVRLAARMQTSSLSNTVTVSAILHTATWGTQVPSQRAVDYGTTLASSRGTVVDAGATANTKSATFTTIAAATAESCRGLIVALGNSIDASRTVAHWLIDVAVGAATAEKIVIPNYYARASINEEVRPATSPLFPVSIPAGSRLSARCQSNNITAGDRALDVVLYSIV